MVNKPLDSLAEHVNATLDALIDGSKISPEYTIELKMQGFGETVSRIEITRTRIECANLENLSA